MNCIWTIFCSPATWAASHIPFLRVTIVSYENNYNCNWSSSLTNKMHKHFLPRLYTTTFKHCVTIVASCNEILHQRRHAELFETSHVVHGLGASKVKTGTSCGLWCLVGGCGTGAGKNTAWPTVFLASHSLTHTHTQLTPHRILSYIYCCLNVNCFLWQLSVVC